MFTGLCKTISVFITKMGGNMFMIYCLRLAFGSQECFYFSFSVISFFSGARCLFTIAQIIDEPLGKEQVIHDSVYAERVQEKISNS